MEPHSNCRCGCGKRNVFTRDGYSRSCRPIKVCKCGTEIKFKSDQYNECSKCRVLTKRKIARGTLGEQRV